jgi:HlyD family secretion protein
MFWRRIALIGVCVAAWSAFALRRGTSVDVPIESVSSGPIAHPVVATGVLRAVRTVQVGAQVSGTVESLYVDYNSAVRAGDVLARLDPASYEAALNEARAQLAEAEAAVMLARANEAELETVVQDADQKLRRAEALSAAQLLMTADLDAARIDEREADAGLDAGRSQVAEAVGMVAQARSAVNEAKINLDRTVITAPIDGVVVSRGVDLGQTVAATLQAPVLFQIAADLSHLQLEADIDESDISRVHDGDRVTFAVESFQDEAFSGTVEQIRLQPVVEATAPATTVGVSAGGVGDVPTLVSYAAIIDVSNTDARLLPGMTAIVTLDPPRVNP